MDIVYFNIVLHLKYICQTTIHSRNKASVFQETRVLKLIIQTSYVEEGINKTVNRYKINR